MKKPRRRKRPAPQAVEGPFGEFGHLGTKFQTEFSRRWSTASRQWKKSRKSSKVFESLPESYKAAFDSMFPSPEHYFSIMFWEGNRTAHRKDTQIPNMTKFQSRLVEVWDDVVRHCFSPALSLLEDLVSRGALRKKQTDVMKFYSDTVPQSYEDEAPICYGPFSKEEMEYLLARHPRIVDGACGTGYFIQAFNASGGDAVGFDSNLYSLSQKGVYPWTDTLLSEGALLQEDISEVDDDFLSNRTLLISWPVSLTPFAFEILDRYTKLGGQSLVLKFGGLLTCSSFTSLDGVRAFFQVLKDHWKPVSDTRAPKWNPLFVENNMFVFERR